MITPFDFDVYQGQSFSLSLVINDDYGNPLNLSGYSASGFLKVYVSSGALASLNATIVPPPINGIISLSMSPAQTAALPVDYLFYDVSIANTDLNIAQKVLVGKVSVYPEVTF